jgi:hypothetical protein
MNLSLKSRLRRFRVLGAVLACSTLASCSSSDTPVTPTVTLASIAVTGAAATAVVGQTAALNATATYSDGTTSNVTAQASWESTNTTVATVSPAGVAVYLAAGTVTFRATFQSVSGSTNVVVAAPAPTITSIAVTGLTTAAIVGESATLVATATYSNGSTAVVTTQAAWSSSNLSVATVSATGAVSFVGGGEADIRASLSGVTGSLRVTVSAQAEYRNLDGTAKDAVSNQSIENVLVVVRGGPNDGRSTRTDANGAYLFTGLLTGSFTVEFSTDQLYSPTSREVSLSGDSRLDVTLTPNVGVYYGAYTITLTVMQDTCQPPPNLSGFGSGTLVLTGQPNGTGVSAKITERGVSRTYTGGRMNVDGSFTGGLPAGTLFPGAVKPKHEIYSSMQGKVAGNSISGTESITYTVGCQPGATITIALSGNK